jgi:hypothetical protein
MRVAQLAGRSVAAHVQPPPPKHTPAARNCMVEKWSAISLHMGMDIGVCYPRYRQLKDNGWRVDALNCIFKQRVVPRASVAPWLGIAPAQYRLTELTLKVLDDLTLRQAGSGAAEPSFEVRCVLFCARSVVNVNGLCLTR